MGYSLKKSPFLTVLALILLTASTPVLAWTWNPLFFWKKPASEQSDTTKIEPYRFFSRSSRENQSKQTFKSSTALSADEIIKRTAAATAPEIAVLAEWRKSTNASMASLRKEQKLHTAKLATWEQKNKFTQGALEKNKTTVAGNAEPTKTSKEPVKTIYVKPGQYKPPKVFTDF